MGKNNLITFLFAIILILGALYAIFFNSPAERFGYGGKLGNASNDHFKVQK